jgi:hypothetical protein
LAFFVALDFAFGFSRPVELWPRFPARPQLFHKHRFEEPLAFGQALLGQDYRFGLANRVRDKAVV